MKNISLLLVPYKCHRTDNFHHDRLRFPETNEREKERNKRKNGGRGPACFDVRLFRDVTGPCELLFVSARRQESIQLKSLDGSKSTSSLPDISWYAGAGGRPTGRPCEIDESRQWVLLVRVWSTCNATSWGPREVPTELRGIKIRRNPRQYSLATRWKRIRGKQEKTKMGKNAESWVCRSKELSSSSRSGNLKQSGYNAH